MNRVPKMPDFLKTHFDRAFKNLARVEYLIWSYRGKGSGKRGRKSVQHLDLLRAAVVFLHATLEDYLRSIAAVYLPRADRESLDEVPLSGVSEHNRPTKFYLGALVKHRGSSVEDVISLSVNDYLERRSFSSIEDVVSLLEGMRMDLSGIRSLLPIIEELMKRRHQIVHQADRAQSTGRGRHWASPINADLVEQWRDGLYDFIRLTGWEMMKLEGRAKLE